LEDRQKEGEEGTDKRRPGFDEESLSFLLLGTSRKLIRLQRNLYFQNRTMSTLKLKKFDA
jgi:hypothetical protein